jgi:hypothetical protein
VVRQYNIAGKVWQNKAAHFMAGLKREKEETGIPHSLSKASPK